MLAALVFALMTQDVFVSGEEGADTYRIPAIARASNGDLLAFAEARNSVSDQAGNRIVLKRRVKGSSVWSSLQIVAEQGKASLNNPCVLTLPRGRVILMFQAYPAGVRESTAESGYDGPNIVRCFLTESLDNGRTWLAPRDITRQAKRTDRIKTICSGPGVGVRLSAGKHRGRLVFPFNEREGRAWDVFALLSDDDGKTWVAGTPAPQPEGESANEVQMAETENGHLLLDARNQGKTRTRLQARSDDGGQTWSLALPVPSLVDPQCMGSLVRAGAVLALSNPADVKTRKNGAVSISKDQGKTWTGALRFDEPTFGYSSLVWLGGNRMGCLYETLADRGDQREHYILRYREFALP